MRRSAMLALGLSLLAGCASSGMKHSELKALLPPPREDEGRIYFLRKSSLVGAAAQAHISLDGKVVGRSQPGAFFYVDAKSGPHEVSAATEVRRALSFVLDPGETKYIRTFPSFGILVGRVNFELVNRDEAEKELAGLFYAGATSAKPAEEGEAAKAKPTESSSESRYPKPHRNPGDVTDAVRPSSTSWIDDSGD